jgi:hypothetical protein
MRLIFLLFIILNLSQSIYSQSTKLSDLEKQSNDIQKELTEKQRIFYSKLTEYDSILESRINYAQNVSNELKTKEIQFQHITLHKIVFFENTAISNIYYPNRKKSKLIHSFLNTIDLASNNIICHFFNNFQIEKIPFDFFLSDSSLVLFSRDNLNLTFEKISISDISLVEKLIKKSAIIKVEDNELFLSSIINISNSEIQAKKLFLLQKDSLSNFLKSTELISHERSKMIEASKKEINELSFKLISSQNEILELKAKDNSNNFYSCKSKTINGVEICLSPLSSMQFRNGDSIKLAKTPSMYRDFNAACIPACHYVDFDEKNKFLGLQYNDYALTDSRNIIPYGFHRLNRHDFQSIKDNVVFNMYSEIKCGLCNNGLYDDYEHCSCNSWTKDQQKYNVCKKCNGSKIIYTGNKIKCPGCNGSGKLKRSTNQGKIFYIFASKSYDLRDYECAKVNYRGELELGYSNDYYKYILLVKDKEITYSDTFDFYRVGDIEIMKTLLKVDQFKNGDKILRIEDQIEWELALKNKIPAYCSNEKTGGGFLYNIHAINDSRGLIPKNWRKINSEDFYHINYHQHQDLEWHWYSSPETECRLLWKTFFSPIKSNISIRDHLADYIEISKDDIIHGNLINGSSGYIICTRDASTTVEERKDQYTSEQIEELILKSTCNSKLGLSNLYWEGQKSRRGFYKNEPNLKEEIYQHSIIDYYPIYNSFGDSLLNFLYQSNYSPLFDEHQELKLIGIPGYFDSISTTFLYEFGDRYYGGNNLEGLIVRQINTADNNIKFLVKRIEFDLNGSQVSIDTLCLRDELNLDPERTGHRYNISFTPKWNRFFNDPISNFHMTSGSTFFDKPGWETSVSGYDWNVKQETQLKKIYDFFESNDKNQNYMVSTDFDSLLSSIDNFKRDEFINAKFPGDSSGLKNFLKNFDNTTNANEILHNCDYNCYWQDVKLIISFEVDKYGIIYNPEITELSKDCLKRCLNIYVKSMFETMPKWIPAYKNGEAINTSITLPVNFSYNR